MSGQKQAWIGFFLSVFGVCFSSLDWFPTWRLLITLPICAFGGWIFGQGMNKLR